MLPEKHNQKNSMNKAPLTEIQREVLGMISMYQKNMMAHAEYALDSHDTEAAARALELCGEADMLYSLVLHAAEAQLPAWCFIRQFDGNENPSLSGEGAARGPSSGNVFPSSPLRGNSASVTPPETGLQGCHPTPTRSDSKTFTGVDGSTAPEFSKPFNPEEDAE